MQGDIMPNWETIYENFSAAGLALVQLLASGLFERAPMGKVTYRSRDSAASSTFGLCFLRHTANHIPA